MQVKVMLMPEEGQKNDETATIRTYDAQGIQNGGDIILTLKEPEATPQDSEEVKKAKEEDKKIRKDKGIEESKEGEESSKETTFTLSSNGYMELDNKGAPVVVDGEQLAGVPDTAEEVKERKEKEDDEKVERARSKAPLDERILRAREEALRNPQAAKPVTHTSTPQASAERKDDKADLSKAPSSSPGHQPTPPGVRK